MTAAAPTETVLHRTALMSASTAVGGIAWSLSHDAAGIPAKLGPVSSTMMELTGPKYLRKGTTAGMSEHDNLAIWEQIAPWWEERTPPSDHAGLDTVVSLLETQPGEAILEVGCGGGWLARLLTAAGARVVATDATRAFLEIAAQHDTDGIEYRWLDATNEKAITDLGAARFDGAVATMVLMNLAVLEPLARGLAVVLKPDGRVVFSVVHPAFSNVYWTPDKSGNRTAFGRLVDAISAATGRGLLPHSVVIWGARLLAPWLRRGQHERYLVSEARRGGDLGQPIPHINWHRPLGALLEPFFDAGFVVDRVVEPPDPQLATRSAVLVVRLRRGRDR